MNLLMMIVVFALGVALAKHPIVFDGRGRCFDSCHFVHSVGA